MILIKHIYLVRLQKDLKELEASGLNGVSFQCADDSGTVIVQFADVIPFAPVTFKISVPRYYPHNPPIIFCVSNGFPCPFILPTGEIVHPGLREEWSAIRTLRTVIDILQSIRLICHNNFQTEYINAGLCCVTSDLNGMDEIKESNEICMAEVMLPGEES
jgi:ubiquitin-protein ligase